MAKELELQTTLGGVLIAARGYSAPETGEADARARALLRQLGASEQLFPVLYGQWVYRLVRGELAEAWPIAGEMLRLAGQRRDATSPWSHTG